MALIRYNDPFRSNPFRELENFFEEFNQASQPGLTTPVADVYLDDDESNLIVEAHLPGYDEDDVDVSVENNALSIRAEQTQQDTEEKRGRKYIVRESSSSFFRRIGLPENIEADQIAAEFDDGVLKVTVPMQELPKPKKVNIEAGKKSGKSKK